MLRMQTRLLPTAFSRLGKAGLGVCSDFSDGHIPELLQYPQTGGLINAGQPGTAGCLLMDGERGR